MRRHKISRKKASEAVRQAKDKLKELEKVDPDRAERLKEVKEKVEKEVEQTNRKIADPDRKRSVIPSKPC
jgi:hypothetical protein